MFPVYQVHAPRSFGMKLSPYETNPTENGSHFEINSKYLFLHVGLDYSSYSRSGIALKDVFWMHQIVTLREK